jgi:hypothetical protein
MKELNSTDEMRQKFGPVGTWCYCTDMVQYSTSTTSWCARRHADLIGRASCPSRTITRSLQRDLKSVLTPTPAPPIIDDPYDLFHYQQISVIRGSWVSRVEPLLVDLYIDTRFTVKFFNARDAKVSREAMTRLSDSFIREDVCGSWTQNTESAVL